MWKKGRRVGVKDRFEDATLLAVKMEEVARIQADSKNWKGRKQICP